MAGAAHETLVEVVRSNPTWFDALLKEFGHAVTPAKLRVADSVVRVLDPAEVRPDVLFVEGRRRGPWRVVELQRDDDADKQRRWLLVAAALFDQRGVMGDVFVVTHTRSTASWARTVASVEGPHGTRLILRPVVVLLTRQVAERLLATGRPELAVFAAWAVHHQRGTAAVKVVQQAVVAAQKARGRELREATIRAILNMLDGTLRKAVYEMVMDFSKIPEGPVHQYLREKFEARGERRGEKRGEKRGEVRGEAEALLTILAARSIAVDAAARERITSCTEATTLTNWITRAATATTLDEVFRAPIAPPTKKPARRARARKPST